jgi:hypothetical protein
MTREEYINHRHTNLLHLAYIFYNEKNRRSDLQLDFHTFSQVFAQYEMFGFTTHNKFKEWLSEKDKEFNIT